MESRPTGPASNVRTAVVWELLSAVLAEMASTAGGRPLVVIDAGGGTGGFAVPLAEAGHQVTVVDPSPDSLAALQRRAAERGLEVRALQGDLTDLPQLVAGQSADLVLCHSVLELVDDPTTALAALASSLRAGGRLSLLVANRDAVVLARALAGRPEEAAHVLTDPAGRWGAPDGTARRWTPAAITELLESVGLAVEQLHGVRAVSDLVPSAVLDVEPGAAAALLALERALADTSPFRELATQLHLLARKAAHEA